MFDMVFGGNLKHTDSPIELCFFANCKAVCVDESSIAEEDEAVLVRTEMVYLLSFARATEVI
jgi:hypothetical protein